EFAPLVPPVLLLIVAFLAAALGGFSVWRRQRAALWRLLTAVLLLLLLGNPSVVLEDRVSEKDIAVVLVDKSRSQSIGTRQEQTAKAADTLSKNLAQLADLDVRVFAV